MLSTKIATRYTEVISFLFALFNFVYKNVVSLNVLSKNNGFQTKECHIQKENLFKIHFI